MAKPRKVGKHFKYVNEILESPDYILEANKPNTAFILKHICDNGKNYQLILRLKTSQDPIGYKNSVITFLKVDDKRWSELYKFLEELELVKLTPKQFDAIWEIKKH